MIRFCLDEDLSYRIAEIVRGRGIDITTSRESGLNGRPDEEQLLFAAGQGRCLVTENFRDFARLTREFLTAGRPHAGVALVPASVPARHFASVAAAIVRLADAYPDGLPPYTLVWLSAIEGDIEATTS